MNRTNIEWTDYTWNPVTGCLHGCEYCYARDIAKRFPQNFPNGFEPMFHQVRLTEPVPWLRPSRIFVCSMADLFGAWVPDEWIGAVFNVVDLPVCQRHTFQFLTKNPKRYLEIDRPANAWYGTTVDGPAALDRIDDLRGLDRTTFVSFEPLTEPIAPDLTGIDLAIIGGRSAAGGLPKVVPGPAWVRAIVDEARRVGAAVFVKKNPGGGPQEYPE